LRKLAENVAKGRPCRFDCPPGFGKSYLLGLVCVLYPQAKIDVISKRVAVLRDRIYPELCGMIPNVGIVGGGRKITGCRVQCYTFDSLQHSPGTADILLADECHEAAADGISNDLACYDGNTVNIGLSATHDMRMDNKDMRVEAIFGPVVFRMRYAAATEGGLVVPIEVHWSDMVMDYNPCGGEADPIKRKRYGIWRNLQRNQKIADNAAADFAAGRQSLITCETLEHALWLKQLLPQFELVYSENGCTPKDQRKYMQLGIWPSGEAPMTLERRANLTAAFEQGKLLGAICTTVWNVGVDFRHLKVLNRADAGGSAIMDTQIPGRTSRLSPDGAKACGIVRDYKDQFDSGFKMRAGGRSTNYAKQGWKQYRPDGTLIGTRAREQLDLF
jgi:superfamily II DNA or RNA helicase